MDRENKIETFEELGLFNPIDTKTTIVDAINEVNLFDFWTIVYSQH
jgi:hypothetical protein